MLKMKKVYLVLFAFCAELCSGFVIAVSPSMVVVENKTIEGNKTKDSNTTILYPTKPGNPIINLERLQNNIKIPLHENGTVKESNVDQRSFILIDTKYKVPFLNHLHNIQTEKEKKYLVENINYKTFVSNLGVVNSPLFKDTESSEESHDYKSYYNQGRKNEPNKKPLSKQMKQLKWKIEAANKEINKNYNSLPSVPKKIPGEEESARYKGRGGNYNDKHVMNMSNELPLKIKTDSDSNKYVEIYRQKYTGNIGMINPPIVRTNMKPAPRVNKVDTVMYTNVPGQPQPHVTIKPFNNYFLPSYGLKRNNHMNIDLDNKLEETNMDQFNAFDDVVQRAADKKDGLVYKNEIQDDRNMNAKDYVQDMEDGSKTTCDPYANAHMKPGDKSMPSCQCSTITTGTKNKLNNKIISKLRTQGEITRTGIDFDFDDAVNKLL